MGRRQGAVRAGLAVGGRIPHQFCDGATPVFRGGYQKLVRAVTDEQRGHRPIFNAPPGRGRLAVFPRCSLDPYDFDMGAYYLLQPSLQLGQPACLVGYEDPNSFFRAFREWEGTTPGDGATRS